MGLVGQNLNFRNKIYWFRWEMSIFYLPGTWYILFGGLLYTSNIRLYSVKLWVIYQLFDWILKDSVVNFLRYYPEICLAGEMKNYEISESG
jgi:hypothetical protein